MKMRKQRVIGLLLIALSILLMHFASLGITLEEQDASGVLFLLPLGVWLVLSNEYLLYDGDAQKSARRKSTSKAHHTQIKKGATPWQESKLPKPRVLRTGRM